MTRAELYSLRTLLVILGILFAGAGLGPAFTGGLAGDVFSQIDQEFDFLVAQNHYQFYAGVFGAAGLTIILCGVSPKQFERPTRWVLGYVAIGGLCRLSLLQWDVILHTEVLLALIFEVVVAGLIGIWVWFRRDAFDS